MTNGVTYTYFCFVFIYVSSYLLVGLRRRVVLHSFIFAFGIYSLGRFLIPVRLRSAVCGKCTPASPTLRKLHADPRIIVGSMTRQTVVGGLSEASRTPEAHVCLLSEES